jgi:rhomboid protease GluP
VFNRKTTGSVVCPGCGSLVGVRDDKCYNCGRSNPGMWGFAPLLRKFGTDLGFVPIVIGGCTIVYVLTLIMSGAAAMQGRGGLDFLAPSPEALIIFGASGGFPVFRLGEWWTVLSASWLHGGLLHILFNMLWVRDLAPATANVIGPARTVVIYTVAGICGFFLSSVAAEYFPRIPFMSGAGLTVGASASIFGLLGALVHYGRKSGSSYVHSQALTYAVILFLFGALMPGGGVDNYAHAGGFLGGYATSMFFNPLTRERGDHMLAAAICLGATVLAILASILYGLTSLAPALR